MQGNKRNEEKRARLVHLIILAALQFAMAAELVFLVAEQQWVRVFLVTGVMLTMALPVVLKSRFPVQIPSEIQILAILFGFATLFLGEVRDYYERFWWWDQALHATAGLLLGLQGFMTVYILNEDRHVDLHMRPSFLAIFAFCFSQAIGAIWEIFEFTMDQVFGLTMQKPMLGDPFGLTDTMWDLIVNAIGALVISVAGWRYLSRGRSSYLDDWVRRFIARNPQLFGD
jgi:hypothetical protein